jgi:hypothetical protein
MPVVRGLRGRTERGVLSGFGDIVNWFVYGFVAAVAYPVVPGCATWRSVAAAHPTAGTRHNLPLDGRAENWDIDLAAWLF